MYLSVKSTQPGCFLKSAAVQQWAVLLEHPRQVSADVQPLWHFVAQDDLFLVEMFSARLCFIWNLPSEQQGGVALCTVGF